ncbi:MAG: glycosyltransferase family 39 protein [Patescibacteria group bacterium]|nr:glycosyltransferase family 39 protein [Patescibacteria group bacterium]
MLKKIKIDRLLLVIFVLALILRLFGIWHGWPFIYNIDEPALVRSAIGIRFNPNPGHFDWPHLHFYLSFGVLAFFYLVRGFFQIVGLQLLLMQIIPFFWKDPAIYYLIVRVFNALLGALTIVPVYLTGRVLFVGEEVVAGEAPGASADPAPGAEECGGGDLAGRQSSSRKDGSFLGRWFGDFSNIASLLSALAFAVFPLHVRDSHLATVDVPMVFWLAWSMYFAAKVLKSSAWRNYIFAGIFAGLAASTKYNGVFILLVIVLAHCLQIWLKSQGEETKFVATFFSKKLLKVFVSGLSALLVFFLGTPYILFDFKTFWSYEYGRGFLWLLEETGSVSSWAEYFANFKYLSSLPKDLSWTLYLIVLFSIGEFLCLLLKKIIKIEFKLPVRMNVCKDGSCQSAFSWQLARLAFLLFFPVFYCLFVMRGKKFNPHYFLAVYPFLALVVGRFTAKIGRFASYLWNSAEVPSTRSQNLNKSQVSKRQIKNRGGEGGTFGISARSVLFALILFVFVVPLYRSFYTGLVYSRVDTRTQASQWVGENVSLGSRVAIVGTETIELTVEGVKYKTYKKLSILDKFGQYDFVLVTNEKQDYMLEKMADNGFELVQEYSNEKPTRRGPYVWIFKNIQE